MGSRPGTLPPAPPLANLSAWLPSPLPHTDARTNDSPPQEYKPRTPSQSHHVLCSNTKKLAAGRREAVRMMHEELADIGRKSVQVLQQQQAAGATGVVTMLGLESEGDMEPRITFEPAPVVVTAIAPLASSATGAPSRGIFSLFKSQAASSSSSCAVTTASLPAVPPHSTMLSVDQPGGAHLPQPLPPAHCDSMLPMGPANAAHSSRVRLLHRLALLGWHVRGLKGHDCDECAAFAGHHIYLTHYHPKHCTVSM